MWIENKKTWSPIPNQIVLAPATVALRTKPKETLAFASKMQRSKNIKHLILQRASLHEKHPPTQHSYPCCPRHSHAIPASVFWRYGRCIQGAYILTGTSFKDGYFWPNLGLLGDGRKSAISRSFSHGVSPFFVFFTFFCTFTLGIRRVVIRNTHTKNGERNLRNW